ncbi:histone H3-like centromeric protein A [Musca vetustissima]|uniref:histone H3-like centromeric protein A n=1 Tax=Musca vetustissima TaxID=27455 RepID=UPI002AB5F033|nr:histone H3-like centromeric protein A [Musca vetustissima]XP_061402228.1 histone H3-like centromeric protein A [Musca vetustissima]
MARGTLGEASDSDVSVRGYSRISNPYEIPPSTSKEARDRGELVLRDTHNLQRETSRTQQRETSRNQQRETPQNQQRKETTQDVLRGAAKRKQPSYRQRQLADLRKIMKLQKSTKLQIPRAPFARLVREITMDVRRDVTHYTPTALEAIQEATEMFITQMLQDAYLLTLHRRCITLSASDIVLIRNLKFNL